MGELVALALYLTGFGWFVNLSIWSLLQKKPGMATAFIILALLSMTMFQAHFALIVLRGFGVVLTTGTEHGS